MLFPFSISAGARKEMFLFMGRPYCLESLCQCNNLRAERGQKKFPGVWVYSGYLQNHHDSLKPGRQLLACTARAPLSQAPQLFLLCSGAKLGTDKTWNRSALCIAARTEAAKSAHQPARKAHSPGLAPSQTPLWCSSAQ